MVISLILILDIFSATMGWEDGGRGWVGEVTILGCYTRTRSTSSNNFSISVPWKASEQLTVNYCWNPCNELNITLAHTHTHTDLHAVLFGVLDYEHPKWTSKQAPGESGLATTNHPTAYSSTHSLPLHYTIILYHCHRGARVTQSWEYHDNRYNGASSRHPCAKMLRKKVVFRLKSFLHTQTHTLKHTTVSSNARLSSSMYVLNLTTHEYKIL